MDLKCCCTSTIPAAFKSERMERNVTRRDETERNGDVTVADLRKGGPSISSLSVVVTASSLKHDDDMNEDLKMMMMMMVAMMNDCDGQCRGGRDHGNDQELRKHLTGLLSQRSICTHWPEPQGADSC
jgi:hypothetical protein